ncbi:adenylate/guanylate cyclase domain-containing protein [Aliifodinibius sp. S!AR15-10]|uniref:adenylate/guanylate cyclase domain-containing protein n=1 Tax=Aliifodinibius sp. S!AR15-10 TaxID=2950437 RepID=UPI00285980D7|nr:adenylate/guanylate cyclase domain-containing protein [Aliifodinibius sp. S!AR15-10]MDR8390878.1 adenylate/guanylate cyclase domain-containing protein [Aliifodinibius sp. S!AR15-10]
MNTHTENTRLLAAVMFIDIVGYTALMQEDEQQAIALRNRKRSVVEMQVTAFSGQIRQYYGDGALVTFQSAYQATLCARKIQEELNKAPIVPVRIGIHMGEIIVTSDGIYGDVVNVASRIESLSFAGGILISDKVEDELKNHPDLKSVFVGRFELRNVARPVEIYAVRGKSLTLSGGEVLRKWEKKASEIALSQLIQPYIQNINAGLIN